MKRIYPEEQKVQPAHSFHSATEVILLKRQLLTSTIVFLFRLCEYAALKHQRCVTNCYTPLAIMFSKIVDKLIFLCTQDNVTLLRASELDTRTRGFMLHRQVLQTICTHSKHCSTRGDMLQWLCLCCNYLWIDKGPRNSPLTLPHNLVSSVYLSGRANKRAVNNSLTQSPQAVNQMDKCTLWCVRELRAELIQ